MSASAIGATRTWRSGTNRAPFVSDGVIDSNLLAASATKTVKITDVKGKPARAVRVTVYNASGFDCTIQVVVLTSQDVNQAQSTETSNPFYIAAGTSVPLDDMAIVALIEKNVGSGTQTGRGVQYLGVLEPGIT